MNDFSEIKRRLLWSAALAAGALLLYVLWPATASSDEERQAVREGRTVILYWDRHSGHEHAARSLTSLTAAKTRCMCGRCRLASMR